MYWQRFFHSILDALYPQYCVGCGTEGSDACLDCLRALPQKSSFIDIEGSRVSYVYEYHASGVGKYIEAWKYHGSQEFIQTWMRLMRFPDLSGFDLVVPVPLHRRRLVERGFNQADIIAKILGKNLNTKVFQALKRHRYTMAQAQCDGEERRKNVRDAFTVTIADVRGLRILLVDDVVTTGSTLQACIEALYQAGAGEIQAFCLARGGNDN